MPLRGPVPVKLCRKEDSEKVVLGPTTIYIFEDGTNTDNRIGCMTLELPPGTSGPPMHWHRFHDECFLVTKGGFSSPVVRGGGNWYIDGGAPGTVRFRTPDGDLDAKEGELMVVPPRAIHTFANPSETEPAEFFMTSTPGTTSPPVVIVHAIESLTLMLGYYMDCELLQHNSRSPDYVG